MEIKITLSESSIEAAIRKIEAYKKWVKQRSEKLLDELQKRGCEIASARFAIAEYDGDNDVKVTFENENDKTRAVVAKGSAVLFIEFGTGVTYPDNHPEAKQHGMIRGAYGQGKGKQKSWAYYGEAGSNGEILKQTDKGTLISTKGNPANMCMYETVKDLKRILPSLAKEIFRE